jgi:hypothetical protein
VVRSGRGAAIGAGRLFFIVEAVIRRVVAQSEVEK